MLIVAAMPFYHELDLLELKLNVMSPYVDRFVICEAKLTYSGLPKPLYFADNKERFKQFNIVHCVAQLPALCDSPWRREEAQLAYGGKVALMLKPDILMWTDTDEAVSESAVKEFVASNHQYAALEMEWCEYYFNRVRPEKWPFRCITRGKQAIFRSPMSEPLIRNAGWHFSYCMNREMLLAKTRATSHAVEDGAAMFRRAIEAGEKPDLCRTEAYPIEKLPSWLVKNRERYREFFAEDEKQVLTSH